MRRVTLLVPWLLLLLGWVFLAPVQWGGATTYLSTQGSSMAPRFHTGDLAILRSADHYRVGDVAAYHSAQLDTVVMHRIVAVDEGRYTFRGDHNSWLDPDRPTEEELLGTLMLRVPRGGAWLQRLTDPGLLGVLALALLAGAGTVVGTRRSRKRRNMTRHAQRAPYPQALTALSPWARTAAAVTAAVGVLGLALALPAWTTPTTDVGSGAATADQTMKFSYRASVPASAAYDGTSVSAPDPVFRKLADTVEVRYAYTGRPGSISVAVELSAPSGWSSTVPLRPEVDFDGSRYTGTVDLDLDALEDRAQAAASVIGIPAPQVEVSVVPTVRTSDGATFEPALPLTMTPLQLTLTDDAGLTVLGPTDGSSAVPVSRTLDLAGRSLSVAAARSLSLALILAALLGAGLLALAVRYSAPASEGARIRRRYAPLLVAVQPVPNPAGRPVVDVVDFAILAKLAERYGLLVLHWSRSGIETFVVQDDSTTYRYRTGSEPRSEQPTAVDAVF